jgi:hypothetical protein
MQVCESDSENEQVGAGRMRGEAGNDPAMAQALGEGGESSVFPCGCESSCEPRNKSVTVAVTTAPRSEPTVDYCVASLDAAGWGPLVFAEPGSIDTGYRTIWNPSKLGIWHNWLSACKWCLANTSTDFIMTVQDDSLFHPDSKSLVDAMAWPGDAAFVSLYTPKHYSIGKPVGINRIKTGSLWGACALLWKRDVLRDVIETPTCRYWLGAKPKSGSLSVLANRKANPHLIANSDTAIGKAINRLGLSMYFVDPSPVHHIARFSTISHGDNTGRRNCGRCSDFDKPLMEQVYAAHNVP